MSIDDGRAVTVDGLISIGASAIKLTAPPSKTIEGIARVDEGLRKIVAGLVKIEASLVKIGADLVKIEAGLPDIIDGLAPVEAEAVQGQCGSTCTAD